MKSLTNAALVSLALVLANSAATAQDHSQHPDVEARPLELRYRVKGQSEAAVQAVQIQLVSPMLPGSMEQSVLLPGELSPIDLLHYLPLGKSELRIEADESPRGRPSLRLAIEGPKLSFRPCLTVNDPMRNRISSLIGNWRYIQVPSDADRDRLFKLFAREPFRKPTLTILLKGEGIAHSVSATKGIVSKVEALDCEVEVLDFFPNYNFDQAQGKPINVSQELENPALLVAIKNKTGTEQRWVFARFPSYEEGDAATSPFKLVFDCPVMSERPVPDFVLVNTVGATHELWSRIAKQVSRAPFALDSKLPIAGSNYTFRIEEFLAKGRLIEEFSPTTSTNEGRTALQIAYRTPEGKRAVMWLEMGRDYDLEIQGGEVILHFGPREEPVAKQG